MTVCAAYRLLRRLLGLALAMVAAAGAMAAPDARIAELAAGQKQPLLDTLKELVQVESGSRDLEGLDKVAQLIADKLRALGGEVELIEPGSAALPEVYRMEYTPDKLGKMVKATFKGTGTRKILLIAHMDTVYQIGMLNQQPFRIYGDKAYGLGIADDKQGIAVILHTLAMLRRLDFKKHAQAVYGELGRTLGADDTVAGGGTDAAFAGLQTQAPVVERFGLQGFGAHSADAEYVLVDSIEPRLYLATRMVMDLSHAKVPAK